MSRKESLKLTSIFSFCSLCFNLIAAILSSASCLVILGFWIPPDETRFELGKEDCLEELEETSEGGATDLTSTATEGVGKVSGNLAKDGIVTGCWIAGFAPHPVATTGEVTALVKVLRSFDRPNSTDGADWIEDVTDVPILAPGAVTPHPDTLGTTSATVWVGTWSWTGSTKDVDEAVEVTDSGAATIGSPVETPHHPEASSTGLPTELGRIEELVDSVEGEAGESEGTWSWAGSIASELAAGFPHPPPLATERGLEGGSDIGAELLEVTESTAAVGFWEPHPCETSGARLATGATTASVGAAGEIAGFPHPVLGGVDKVEGDEISVETWDTRGAVTIGGWESSTWVGAAPHPPPPPVACLAVGCWGKVWIQID